MRRLSCLVMSGSLLAAGAVVAAAPANAAIVTIGSSLTSGKTMVANQQLATAQYRLIFQSDGNLVETGNGRVLWSSGTSGKASGGKVVMRSNGIASIYNSAGAIVWSSGSTVSNGATLNLIANGSVYTRSTAGAPVWQNGRPGSESLSPGGTLVGGQYLTSRSGLAKLVMQADGKLVQVGSRGGTVWSVACAAGSKLTMKTDASLAITTPTGATCWKAGSMLGTTQRLTIRDDNWLVRTTSTVARSNVTPTANWNNYLMGPQAAAVFAQLNKERAAHSLPALAFDSRLWTSAQKHNQAMSAADTLSHQLPGELSPGSRISATGYKWSTWGENCAYNWDTSVAGALQMETMMYNEVPPNDGHRKNILSSQFTQVGVAVYVANGKLWITEDFGRPA